MARKTPRRVARRTARKAPRRTARSLRQSRARAPAKLKSPAKRSAADHAAAAGALPQWTTAEIEEAFRRFQAARPEPKGELEHIDPFTLLVAVVLSAQATDAGVNKATPALFAAADTPEKMAALGEKRLQDLIKTIGLFRTKAKNLIALSKKIVHEHGGEVPRTREALEALPASVARPRMSCSTSPSVRPPSRSTLISSASAIGPGWQPAKRRSRSRSSSTAWCRRNTSAMPTTG